MLLKLTLLSSELLAWGCSQCSFTRAQVFFKLQPNIRKKSKNTLKRFWVPVVMVLKFQCPDTSHPSFSFSEPFQHRFPGTRTDVSAVPAAAPTLVRSHTQTCERLPRYSTHVSSLLVLHGICHFTHEFPLSYEEHVQQAIDVSMGTLQ